MKNKVLLIFILSLLSTVNSFAIQITGGKLISHKEWTQGNVIKSSFKDITSSNTSRIPVSRFKKNETIENWITASSRTIRSDEASIPVNKDITFSGVSHIHILNDSDSVQKTYSIIHTMNVFPPCPSEPGHLCPTLFSIVEDVVMLEPNGSAFIEKEPTLTTRFDSPGKAYYWIEQNIEANDASLDFNTSSNTESIQVTENNLKNSK